MRTRNGNNTCLWSVLLAVTVAACVTLVYVYSAYAGVFHEWNNEVSTGEAIKTEKRIEDKCIPVCESHECIQQATMLLGMMNQRVDPCDNFRTFLCGAFEERFGPEEVGTTWTDTELNMLKTLKGIIENIDAEPDSASAKMKILYDSCMDKISSEIHAFPAAQEFIKDLGILNWPKLDQDFKFIDNSLFTTLGKLISYGELKFLYFIINSENPEEPKISIGFTLNLFNKMTRFSKEAGEKLLKYFNLEPEEIDEILKEYEVVKRSILNVTEEMFRHEENSSDITLHCSRETDDDWRNVCGTVQAFLYNSECYDTVNKYVINIEGSDIPFLKKLFRLLNMLPERYIANFIAMNFFWNHVEELNFYFRFAMKEYITTFKRETPYLIRWKYCVNYISKNMYLALTYEFFQHYLTKPAVEEIVGLYDEYVSHIAGMIAHQDWIPEGARSTLGNQIRHMPLTLPLLKDKLPNATTVNGFYKMFHPARGNFFQNVIQLQRTDKLCYNNVSQENVFDDSVPYLEFQVMAATALSGIGLDFGMFFSPFYHHGLPSQINRVSLAPTCAHELGHIVIHFLHTFAKYDNETRSNFEDRRRCIGNQFSNFKFEILQVNLDGTIYIEENLSDNLYALLLDKMIGESNGEEIFLPGLPYTRKQLQYMSANEVWCSKFGLQQEMHFQTADEHAPYGFRLLGTMQNSRGFSEAFQCPNGSYMNPAIKCSLFDLK